MKQNVQLEDKSKKKLSMVILICYLTESIIITK